MADSKEKKSEAPAAAASKGGLSSWIPLIVTVLMMPAMAFAITKFMIIPQLKAALPDSIAHAEASASDEHSSPSDGGHSGDDGHGVVAGKNFEFKKIITNVGDTQATRYLMVKFTVAGSVEDFTAKVEQHQDQLRDIAIGTLLPKTIIDLEQTGAKNQIRTELLSNFNNAIGYNLIEALYFTDFAIQ